jgi:hypothetical protein
LRRKRHLTIGELYGIGGIGVDRDNNQKLAITGSNEEGRTPAAESSQQGQSGDDLCSQMKHPGLPEQPCEIRS